MKLISLVVPCYNEMEVLPIFYEEIKKLSKELSQYNFEFIFVDDGSKDETLNILKQMNKDDSRCTYISFSRNFGKEAAIYAGLQNASGDYTAVMDADLQDPPALLPEMLNYIENENYDMVGTRRVTRKGEPPIRSFFARMFYKVINSISKVEMVDGARDYRLMSRQVVESILSLNEYNRYSKGIFSWVGYKTKWMEYENQERAAGETKWSFWKLFIYAIEGIVAFSTTPLIIATFLGFFISMVAVIAIIVVLIKTLAFGDPTTGWPSMIIIVLFLSGIQLVTIGILGQYVAKTYMEVKKRPIYIAKFNTTAKGNQEDVK